MNGALRWMQESYHNWLIIRYRLAERVAEFANLSRRISLLILVIGLSAGYLLALAIANEAWIGVGLLLVLTVALPFFALRPEWLVISCAFAVASLISPLFWDVLAFAERGITLPNVLVFYGLLILLFRFTVNAPINRSLWSTPTTIAVVLFLLLSAVVGFVYHSSLGGLSYRKELAELQHMILWLTYFLCIGVCTDRRTLGTVQAGILGVAAIGALPTILQAIVGEQVLFFLKLTQKDIRLEQMEGLTRVIPPGENLMLVAFFIAWQMVVMSSGPKRLGWVALSALYGFALLMTLTRHSWFAALFGLGVFWLFSSVRNKVNTAIALVIVGTLIGSAVLLVRSPSVAHPDDFFARISRRFMSTFAEDPQRYMLTRVSSVGQRVYEMNVILDHITESPWLGLGWSTRLPLKIAWEPYRQHTINMTTYVHNSFWWIVAKGGIVGVLGLLVLWLTGAVRGYQLYRKATDQFARAWLLALWVGFLGLILAGQFEPVFWIRNRLIAAALTLALMELVYHFGQSQNDHIQKEAQV